MKKHVVLLSMMLLATFLLSAQSPADKIFEKYSGVEGYTSVYITKHMFNLFADIETEEDEEGFVELVKNLDCIKIVAYENEGEAKQTGHNFYDEIMADFPSGIYEDLMIVKKKDQDIKFMIKKGQDDKISELLMISGGSDNVLISIQGAIDLKTISKLSSTLNISGMEKLEEIDNEE